MTALARIVFTVAAILCLQCGACDAVKDDVADVVSVYDGDTVRLRGGTRIRLAGIDAPERDPEQYYARKSTDRLRQLIGASGGRVRVHGIVKDRYGRSVAELFTPDGTSLSERMLSEGMASFYHHKELSEDLSERLLAAQRRAIGQRRGMWDGLLKTGLNERRYVGNRNSHRFFPAGSEEGNRISRRNRVFFRGLEEAYRAGYAPARPCNIFPLANQVR